MASTSPFLSQREAARFLSLSVRTLERFRLEGGGPAYCRSGIRRVAYSEAELRRWAQSRTYPNLKTERALG
jgi:predicted DNA-binding transcriptional regulator AlpA